MTITQHAQLEVKPLMSLTYEGDFADPGSVLTTPQYTVWCTEHGNVTRPESGGIVNTATLQQAGVYTQRHLARHLTALAEEIARSAR